MKPEQIKLITESFRQVAPQADVAADVFYIRLFESEPRLRQMFPADLREQKRKLMKTLALAVASLERFAELKPALEELGRKHQAYGVREEFYPMVGGALLWTLNELLGAAIFDAETEEAWTQMYEIVSETMLRAAEENAEMISQSSITTAELTIVQEIQPQFA